MFGGKGIYADGRIFALVLNDELFLKTDAQTASRFEAAGSRRWTYQREGAAPVAMPYHSVPEEALDDPDLMADWARLAMEAAVRGTARKSRRHAPSVRLLRE
ncbi:DNA transformation protein [Aureimonas phyllosphaerae]|nr:DNA transformation protein [Aureimonas phyllosphaerae]